MSGKAGPVIELCRHVYSAGGRCLGPEEAERHHQPRPSHILPEFGHEYVAGALVPWPLDWDAVLAAYDPEWHNTEAGLYEEDRQALFDELTNAALGVDDDRPIVVKEGERFVGGRDGGIAKLGVDDDH